MKEISPDAPAEEEVDGSPLQRKPEIVLVELAPVKTGFPLIVRVLR